MASFAILWHYDEELHGERNTSRVQIATRNPAPLVGGRLYTGVERATYVPASTLPFAGFGRWGCCSGRARNARAFGLGRSRARRCLPQGPARRPGSVENSEGCPIDGEDIDAAIVDLDTCGLMSGSEAEQLEGHTFIDHEMRVGGQVKSTPRAFLTRDHRKVMTNLHLYI